jgi:hypothetical protein
LGEASRALYDELLRSTLEHRAATRLFVAPDGKLHLLPFDALLRLQSAAPRVVATVPSAGVLSLLRTRPTVHHRCAGNRRTSSASEQGDQEVILDEATPTRTRSARCLYTTSCHPRCVNSCACCTPTRVSCNERGTP